MKYMIIAAHPDDEALGVGGFLYQRIKNGEDVCVVIANEGDIPTRPEMREDMRVSHHVLGIRESHGLGLANLQIEHASAAAVVPRIEKIIGDFEPDYIFTHSPTDINPDHRAVSAFAQQAARFYQRHPSQHRLRGLFFFEVLSSTDWGADIFEPDTFLEISVDALVHKIEALACYRNVLRHDTHPRSARAIEALAVYRGCTVGVRYAEAVKTCWRIEQEDGNGTSGI